LGNVYSYTVDTVRMIEIGSIGWTRYAEWGVGGLQELHAKDIYVKSQENNLHSMLYVGVRGRIIV
jgi:hypothetical protein